MQIVQLQTKLQYYENECEQLKGENQLLVRENQELQQQIEQLNRQLDECSTQILEHQVEEIKLVSQNERLRSSSDFYMKLINNYESQKQAEQCRAQADYKYYRELEAQHNNMLNALVALQDKLRKQCSDDGQIGGEGCKSIMNDVTQTITELQNTCLNRMDLQNNGAGEDDSGQQQIDNKTLHLQLQYMIDERQRLKSKIDQLFSDEFLSQNGLTRAHSGPSEE